jgi:PAS domain-containing protein
MEEWETYLQDHIASLRSEPDPENARREALSVLDTTYAELSVTTEELDRQNNHLETALQRCARIERRYVALTSMTRDAILETDEAGTIKEANYRLARRLNVPEDMLVGKPLLLYIWDHDYPIFHNALRQVPQQSVDGWDIHLQARHGSPNRCVMSAKRLEADHSNAPAILWVFRDSPKQPRTLPVEHQIRQVRPEFRA